MHTTHRTISAIFLAIFFAFTPHLASAQVVDTPVTASQVEEIIKRINDLQIQLLLARIAELQAQIATLLAQQSAQATQLGAVESKVSEVVTQVTPVVVAPVKTNSVSLGLPSCTTNGNIQVPINVTGDWSSGSVKYMTYVAQNNEPMLNAPKKETTRDINPKDKVISFSNWGDTYNLSVSIDGIDLGVQPVTVFACN